MYKGGLHSLTKLHLGPNGDAKKIPWPFGRHFRPFKEKKQSARLNFFHILLPPPHSIPYLEGIKVNLLQQRPPPPH